MTEVHWSWVVAIGGTWLLIGTAIASAVAYAIFGPHEDRAPKQNLTKPEDKA